MRSDGEPASAVWPVPAEISETPVDLIVAVYEQSVETLGSHSLPGALDARVDFLAEARRPVAIPSKLPSFSAPFSRCLRRFQALHPSSCRQHLFHF